MKATRSLSILAAAALAAACATAGGGSGSASTRVKQADHAPLGSPSYPVSSLSDEFEISYIKDANNSHARGEEAQRSGNMDQARAEFAAAADGYAAFMDKFPSELYRMPLRMRAAELFMYGQQPQKAAEQAQKVMADPEATAQSKAIGAKLAAEGWLGAANAKVRAGQLDPIRLANADQRRSQPLAPRVPPGEWKNFVDASDRLLEALRPPDVKPPDASKGGLPVAQIALIAAEVSYSFDNMEDAQRRFAHIIEKFPAEAEVLVDAVPLYLQTFLFREDEAGYQAAVDRIRAQVEASFQATNDMKAKAAYAKIQEALGRATAGVQFASAQRLLEQGKPAEAAEAFEKLAADPKGGDVPNALHNAAVAWDKAQQPEKAAALRQRIVTEFGDSRVAPNNALLLAVHHSKKGQHVESAKMYTEFLAKYPESPNRCVALQNVASELDQAKKAVDAADRYLTFGKDAACAKENPNTTALALYRSGRLFQEARKKAEAKEAYAAAAALQGVTDAVAKSQVEDARRRMKSL
jgi:tetratricopeptide (TPR) repeat protein